jgi:hypothetical protein
MAENKKCIELLKGNVGTTTDQPTQSRPYVVAKESLPSLQWPSCRGTMQTVLFDFHRQGCSLAKKISILRDGSSHRRVSLLPGDSHTPRRQSFVHLHRLQEAPAFLAFVNGEIGACLILCDAVKISASALKNMNRADHLATPVLLLPSSTIQL